MFGGEGMNFAAYTFAPAALVAPLAALTIISTAILLALVLHERLNVFAQLGVLLCMAGTTLLVLFAPKVNRLETLQELFDQTLKPGLQVSFSSQALL